ncbi:MAG: hypothetical protein QXO71_11710 [Candidatus Jordarchaeaceae archaeon]
MSSVFIIYMGFASGLSTIGTVFPYIFSANTAVTAIIGSVSILIIAFGALPHLIASRRTVVLETEPFP